jgi:hypothetical protein
MNKRFLQAYFNRGNPAYKKTIESLTAFLSYKSLEEDKRKEYGKYLQELEPLLFNLSPFELTQVELSLPPYPGIEEYVYRKAGIKEEDLLKLKRYRELLSKKPFRILGFNVLSFYSLKLSSHFKKDLKEAINADKEVNQKIITKEYKEILDERSKEIIKTSRIATVPIYISTALLHYFRTQDLSVEAAYLSSILASNLLISLPYISKIFGNENYKKILQYIQMIALSSAGAYIYYRSVDPLLISVYLITSVLPFWILGSFEIGLGDSISSLIEKSWPYLPKKVRKIIDKSRRFFAGIKVKPFNEKEIYDELYDASTRLEKVSSLPSYVFQEFREKLEKGVIKVENPEEKLALPYALGYYRKEIVLVEGGNKWRVVNRKALEELAKIYGMSIEDFEKDVLKKPWKYLEFDAKNGKRVYGRSVIGMYNFENEALRKGVAAKEVEACLLGLYANNLSILEGLQ